MILLVFLIILFSFNTYSQIFVAPDGDNENPGTIELPLKTLAHAVSLAGPDSLIYLRGGVYYEPSSVRLNTPGQPDKPIKIWAYPGEVPILDFSTHPIHDTSRAIRVSSNYWHLKGLVVRRAGDNGIFVSGWYNIIENCDIYECHDTGLQIGGNARFNKIINCDSYSNYDPQGNGEDADGFAAKGLVGEGNEFIGCRAWGNSDDGWDLWETSVPVLIDSCWAFQNGFNVWGDPNFQGDGNGFKLGGNFVPASHTVTRSVAFDNRVRGFDQNNNAAGLILYNNTAFRNPQRNFSLPSNPNTGVHILKNNLSYLGNNIIIVSSNQEANSWQSFTVTDNDFISLDTALAKAPRNADSSLPHIDFLKLSKGSSLIDAGVPVGLPFNDLAPDLGAFETDGIPNSVYIDDYVIDDFNLHQNFPNPFNPSTKFSYSILSGGNVNLKIFNILGKKVAEVINDYHNPGYYEVNWTAIDYAGNPLPSGIYFVKLFSENKFRIIKISLIK